MSQDTTTSFLKNYIHGLSERSREERGSFTYGFDTIIYNLALAEGWKPMRLPFLRGGANQMSRPKSEAEFGIDGSFLCNGGKRLVIFVLKDEPLLYQNWTRENFDSDLRRASDPDLSPPEYRGVKEVLVVLAYNKDEDQRGIDCFERRVRAQGKKVGNRAKLRFERWNLTEITERVQKRLLTPSLLPERFFGQFTYICSQVGDFVHGSDKWCNQLVPNWNDFLQNVLRAPVHERAVRMIPVALFVIRAHGKQHPSFAAGWIDLIEWAMLVLWRVYFDSPKKNIRAVIRETWAMLYLSELELFYEAHSSKLCAEHSLEVRRTDTGLDPLASAYVAFWHVARIGLLAMAYREVPQNSSDEVQRIIMQRSQQLADMMIGLINANPATRRPILDLHHIELFLVWRLLWVVGRESDIYGWLSDLQQRLLVRRLGRASIPFISTNSWEIAFERAASDEQPPAHARESSSLLLMLLELCCSLPEPQRDELLKQYHLRIVRAVDDDGEQLPHCQPVDLLSWTPPKDWEKRILAGHVSDGLGITVTFSDRHGRDPEPTALKIEECVRQTREKYPLRISGRIPRSVFVLACLKHRSPLRSELWRILLFPPQAQ